MPDFVGETWFIVTMIVSLLALIGMMLFLRSRRPEDDE